MAANIKTSEYTSAYEYQLPCKKVDVGQQQEKPLFGFIADKNRRVFHFFFYTE